MRPSTLLLWLGQAFRQAPAAWILLATLILLGGLVGEPSSSAVPAQLGLLAGLVGVLCTMVWLERGEELLRRSPVASRLLSEGLALYVGAATFGSAALVPALLAGREPGVPWVDLAMAWAHLTAASMLLLEIPVLEGGRAWILLFATWILPLGVPVLTQGPLPSLVPAPISSGADAPFRIWNLLPISGLLLGTALLATRTSTSR